MDDVAVAAPPRIVTGPEFRALLKISKPTYTKLVRRGLPQFAVPGMQRRHDVDACLRWLEPRGAASR